MFKDWTTYPQALNVLTILLHFKLSLKLFEFRRGKSATLHSFNVGSVQSFGGGRGFWLKSHFFSFSSTFSSPRFFLSTQTFSICCAAAQCRWSRVMYFTNFKGLNSIFAISGNCRKPFLKPPCLKYSHLGAKEQAEQQQPTSDLEIWASRALVFLLLPCEWMDPSSSLSLFVAISPSFCPFEKSDPSQDYHACLVIEVSYGALVTQRALIKLDSFAACFQFGFPIISTFR